MMRVLSDHAEFFHQVPDEYLADALPVAKKIAAASNLKQYNVLQVSSLSRCSWMSCLLTQSHDVSFFTLYRTMENLQTRFVL